MKNTILMTLAMLALTILSAQASSSVKNLNANTGSSSVKWVGTKVTGKHWGDIKVKSGKLALDGEKIKSGSIEIDMTSITVDPKDLQGEWATKLINHLKNDDFFSVNKYKTSKFDITSAKKLSKGTYEVEGNLTIKDITKKQKVKLQRKGNSFSGKLVFDRTDYNIRYGSGKFFSDLGDKMIHDKVSLDLNIKFN